ncbi:MAG: ABC transporter substrate-binding protein [Thermoleophilia bacterium]|nr:ABC transporter substrate-binding protein [Thermoleophilia bacterium]
MKRRTWSAALLALLLAAAVTGCGGDDDDDDAATETAAAGEPIVIGWAFDSSGQMAPFDGPALAAARIRVQQLNDEGGVDGRQLRIDTCDTQNNNPARAKACATQLLDGGAHVVFVTCDVDFATPVVQEAIGQGTLAIAPCIGTDQMGPKRFGEQGRLAFSFGNVAQDEGSAMAEFAYGEGWRTAALGTNTLLVYFKNVVEAFEKRFTELGGRIAARETYATGANNVDAAVSRLNGANADVIVTSTAFGELPAFVSGLRSLRNRTPILNSWAGDGTYWVTKNPPVTNYFAVTYASVFGDDPSQDVKEMIEALGTAGSRPATGGFLAGAGAVDGVAEAIRRADGSTEGEELASELEQFDGVETISGQVSFSPELHTVFGREYRVIRIHDNKGEYVQGITAEVVPELGG